MATGMAVGFHMPCNNRDGYVEERKKYLTAKYGAHQMKLIRKRLKVEDVLDKELRKLYQVSEDDTYDCEIDLDEVLDLDEVSHRRKFLQNKVASAKQPPQIVNQFIDVILEQVVTL